MKELIDALTRAANAVAAHYEKGEQGCPDCGRPMNAVSPVRPLSEDAPAPKARGGKKKVDAPASPNDDILAEASGKGTAHAAPKKKEEMTEEESAKAVTDTAKLLVSKYSKPSSPDNKPEGFHIAKALLIEDFKVGRLSDLSHEQRVEFVAVVKGILTDDKKAQEILSRKAAAV